MPEGTEVVLSLYFMSFFVEVVNIFFGLAHPVLDLDLFFLVEDDVGRQDSTMDYAFLVQEL